MDARRQPHRHGGGRQRLHGPAMLVNILKGALQEFLAKALFIVVASILLEGRR